MAPPPRNESRTTGAVLVAAGRGQRFGERKQFRRLGGRPLYQYSLNALGAHPLIGEIAIVVPEDSVATVRNDLNIQKLEIPLRIVPGGERRQDSVLAGIQALENSPEWVCIHDAARPFITTKNLDRCLEACTQYSGAITAIPSPDTVKQISVERMVIRTTLPRETIWLAQTPQVFERELIQSLLLTAARSDQTVTDEASLAEQAGIEVAIVEGSPMNRKITTWEDWQWAVARVNRNEAADAH